MRIRPSFFSKLFILLGLLSACTSVPEITPTQTQTPNATPTLTATPAPPPAAREIGSLGNGTAQDIAWTPDGQSLIVAGSNGLHFYDPLSGKLQRQIDTPIDKYAYSASMGISQDGSKVILAKTTAGIWQTDLASGQTTLFLRDAIYFGSHAFYSRDLKKMVFLRYTIPDRYTTSYSLLILDAQTGQTLFTLIESDTPEIYAVKLSPDGHTLAAARADNLIHLFNLDTGESLGTLSGHESDVVDLDFSPDGKTLASVSPDASLRIWDLQSKQLFQTIRGFKESPRAVVYSADGNALYGLISDGQIERWMVDAKGLVGSSSTLFRSSDLLQRIVLQPGGTWLALLGKTGQIQVLDLKTGQIMQSFLDFGGDLETLAWSRTGSLVAAATSDWQHPTIFVWDAQAHQLQRRFELGIGKVTDLAFSPDGKTLVAVDNGGHLRFWNLASVSDSPRTETISLMRAKLAFSPDGQFLAVASQTFQLWGLDGGEGGYRVIHEAKIADNPPLALAYSPDGKAVALATQLEVTTWDAVSGELLSNWKTVTRSFETASLFWESGSGRVAFASLWDNRGISFYNLGDGASLYRLQFEKRNPLFFTLGPDHRLLAIGSDSPTVYDPVSGALLWGIEGQDWRMVAFHPEGNLLATSTSGMGNILHLWDVSTLAQAVRQIPAATATSNPTPAQTVTPTSTQPVPLAMTALTPPAPQPGAIGRENLSRLVEKARFGKGRLLGVAWAAGGRYFAVSTSLGVHVYAVEPYREIAFAVIPGENFLFALSPAADKILTADLGLWGPGTGQKISQLSLPEADPASPSSHMPARLRFSPDGESILADFYDGKTCTWKVGQPQPVACRSNRVQGWDTTPLTVSPDGQWVVLQGTGNNVALISTLTQTVVHTFEYGENAVTRVIFSPDGQTLVFASCEVDRTTGAFAVGKSRVEIWQIGVDGKFTFWHGLETGKWNGTIFDGENVLTYTPDSSRLVTLNDSGEAQFWDVQSGKQLSVTANAGNHLLISPDGVWMLTWDGENRIDLWKISSERQPELVQSLDGFSAWIDALSISADGSLFSAGWNWASKVQRWDLSASSASDPAQRFETFGRPFAVSLDGSWLAANATNGVAQIIELSGGKVLASFPAALSESGSPLRLVALVLSPDKRWLATVGSDQKIVLWDAQSGKMLRKIDKFWTDHLIFSPDGRYLAASGNEPDDGKMVSHTSLVIWKVETGERVRYFDLIGSQIAFHPNGVQILSARADGLIQLLDLRSGKPVWTTIGPESISSLAFSPDGSLLAILDNKTVQFLDAETGKLLTELPAVPAPSSLTFSPDGKILAIGADGTIRLYGIR